MEKNFTEMVIWECRDCHHKKWAAELSEFRTCLLCHGYMAPWPAIGGAPAWSREFKGGIHSHE